MARHLAVALLLGVALCGAQARFIIENGGLKIILPSDARKKYPEGFDTSLGNFGSPVYGGQLSGQLVYPEKGHGSWGDIECNPPCRYACQPFNETSPKMELAKDKDQTYLLMADRGPNDIAGVSACKFAEKTWNAQLAGAKGIIVVNYEDKQTTMYAPEDDEESYRWLKNITIPAVFVTKSTGDALKALLRDSPEVFVSLDWQDVLPRAKTVNWEFWTNSNDACGAVCDVQQEFIKAFKSVAQDLEQHNWTSFTPHYKVWRCPDSYKESDECRKQCIHKGRYCSPDPDSEKYAGREVVQENLRQLCLFQLANKTGQPWLWWDYVDRFATECEMDSEKYGKECAEQAFLDIGGDKWSSLDAFRGCVGDIDADRENELMEAEYHSQIGDETVGEVYILPTIRINNEQYRGKLAFYEVMRALCTGFNKDYEPAACLKVQDNDCMDGAAGDRECKKEDNVKLGKTQCVDTFVGFKCACGAGFYTHTNDQGEEECLDVNECWSAGTSLGHNCTCERCACHNTWGSYECLTDLPNKCTEQADYGGCWRGKYELHGKKTLFTACKDNLSAYKAAAANGEEMANFPIHQCECPPCFVKDGSDCKPACNLDTCDMNTGMCTGVPTGGSSGASFPGWAFATLVVAVVVVVAAGGYFVYWFRLRSAMHNEIRAIMAQYMPLDSQGGGNVPGGPPGGGMGGGGLGGGLSSEMSKVPNGL